MPLILPGKKNNLDQNLFYESDLAKGASLALLQWA